MNIMVCSYCGIPWRKDDGDGTCQLCHRGVPVEREFQSSRSGIKYGWLYLLLLAMAVGIVTYGLLVT